MKRIFIFLLFLSLYSSTWALEEENSYKQMLQEVIRTELVYPQEKGEVQISLLPTYFNNSEAKTSLIPLGVEYGLTNRWQFDLFVPYVINRPVDEPKVDGIGDIVVGTRYSFMNIAQSNYHAALLFEAGIITGNINKGLTEGFYEYEPSVAFAKDFPNFHNSQFFGQVGFVFLQRGQRRAQQVVSPEGETQEEGDEEVAAEELEPEMDSAELNSDIPGAHSFFLSVGYFLPVDNVRYVIEANWETNQWNHNGTENQVYITPGIVVELPKRWEVALGGSVGLTPTSDKYDIFLRATYEFDILQK